MEKKVDGIIKTTQRNATLGFLKASIMVVIVLAGVVGYLYKEAARVSEERLNALNKCVIEGKQIEADYRQYLKDQSKRKDHVIIENDSTIKIIK